MTNVPKGENEDSIFTFLGGKINTSNFDILLQTQNNPLTMKMYTKDHLSVGYICTKLGGKMIHYLRDIPNSPTTIFFGKKID